MYQHISYEVLDPVAIITMDRPDFLNAVTHRMQAELKHALAAAEQDPRVVGIVLTGAGRGFCAGADMQRLSATAGGDSGADDEISLDLCRPIDPVDCSCTDGCVFTESDRPGV